MFVAAWSQDKTSVVYRSDDGKEYLRSGGSRSWRNFNPGNIIKGSFADSCGAIGGDARFAIFPDEETGLAAILSLLQGNSYRNLTISQAINKYAPKSDGNDSDAYVESVCKQTGLSAETILKKIDKKGLAGIAQAIRTHEGWKEGSTSEIAAPMQIATGGILAQHAVGSLGALAAAASSDGKYITRLIEIGKSAKKCAEIRTISFKAMTRIFGYETSKKACACTLSCFLRAAGVNIEIEYGAGRLARILEKERGWERVKIGQQQPGDVAVTLDQTKPVGADHIFYVVEVRSADELLIVDNQTTECPHSRSVSGGDERTPVDYFLRAPAGPALVAFLQSAAHDGVDDVAEGDEETDNLVVRFTAEGALL